MGETLEEQQPVAAEVENQFLWARRTAGGGKAKKFSLPIPRSSSNNGLERTNRRIRARRSGRARLERNFALSTSSSYCVLEVSFPTPARSERILSMETGRGKNEKGPSFKREKEPRQLFLLLFPPQKNNATCCRFPNPFRHYQGSPLFCWERLGRKMDKRKEGKPLFLVFFWH